MIIKRIDKHISKGHNRNPKTLADRIKLVYYNIFGTDVYVLYALENGKWNRIETVKGLNNEYQL